MSASETSKLCRICLASNIENYKSLFETYKKFSVNDYILLITNIEMKKDDGFPDKICANCFLELETAVNFKQKCENSDVLLKSHKDRVVEACVETAVDNIVIVKTEPYEVDVQFEEATGGPVDEEYAIEKLEDPSVSDVKPVKRKRIDLKLECHDCGNLFKSKCKLRVHWKKTHMLSSLICDICKRIFKSYKAYHLHKNNKLKSCNTAGNNMVRVEGEGRSRVFYCNECDYKSVRVKDIQSHIVKHNGDRPFQCTICQKTYTQQSSLQSHMEGTHKKYLVEVTCQFCGKQLKGRTQMYRHIRAHTEEKLSCPICQKSMSKKNLKVHMQRHSGTKSFTCEKCASTFYTLGELCNHRRWVHNKKKDAYKCDLCSYTACRPDRIKAHRKNHMGKNIPCTVCGQFFATVPKLDAHMKQHSDEKKYYCLFCEKKFCRRDSVGKHIKSKHRNIVQDTMEKICPTKFKVEPTPTKTLVNLTAKKAKESK